jgi:hypothetical protein
MQLRGEILFLIALIVTQNLSQNEDIPIFEQMSSTIRVVIIESIYGQNSTIQVLRRSDADRLTIERNAYIPTENITNNGGFCVVS